MTVKHVLNMKISLLFGEQKVSSLIQPVVFIIANSESVDICTVRNIFIFEGYMFHKISISLLYCSFNIAMCTCLNYPIITGNLAASFFDIWSHITPKHIYFEA